MRILYDHQVFSLQNAGGASRYHYELARNLGMRPDVLVNAFLGFNGTVHPFESLKGVRTLSIRSTLRPGMLRYAINEALTGACASLGERWDVYHPTLYRAMPLVRYRKLVVTHHDCTHEQFPELFPDVNRILRAKARLFSTADAIICVSQSSRRDLLRFYSVDPKKTQVIYHGHSPLRSNGAGHFEQPLRRPYLLYVGARHGYKNFGRLLRAYKQARLMADYDLLAVGGGEWSSEEIQAGCRLGVRENMQLLPAGSESALAEAYSHAALFVYPSLYEGFGFPPLEAMSAGCVVAAGSTSSLPEVCGDTVFYFDPSDEFSIAKVLVEALNSPAKQQKIKAGAEHALMFSWAKCAEETLRLYRSN